MALSKDQLHTLATVERVASIASALGVATIIGIFCLSPQFRNPIHRVVFINAFYNIFDVTATMISLSGPNAGNPSALCQFQGFLMQMFPIADVFWTLAMAIDVFLIVFYKYEAKDLHKLEAKYIGVITSLTLIPAVAFLFVHTQARSHMYGSVTLWCAISPKWVLFRIIFYYVPIWLSIAVIIVLYALVGIEILKQRHALKAFDREYVDLDEIVPKRTFVIRSSIGVALSIDANVQSHPVHFTKGPDGKDSAFASLSEATSHPHTTDRLALNQTPHTRPPVSFRAYILMPVLFFVILLAVWVAPTVNRVHTFIDPAYVSYPLLLAVGSCGSLRGFWNGVVFIVVGMKERKRRKYLKQTYH